jgi:hypothetical protein
VGVETPSVGSPQLQEILAQSISYCITSSSPDGSRSETVFDSFAFAISPISNRHVRVWEDLCLYHRNPGALAFNLLDRLDLGPALKDNPQSAHIAFQEGSCLALVTVSKPSRHLDASGSACASSCRSLKDVCFRG